MSENPDQWEQMLRAVLGDEAAEQIIGQMRSQGIDPGAQMQQMMNPANFNQVVSQLEMVRLTDHMERMLAVVVNFTHATEVKVLKMPIWLAKLKCLAGCHFKQDAPSL